jgi:hypothetical protein
MGPPDAQTSSRIKHKTTAAAVAWHIQQTADGSHCNRTHTPAEITTRKRLEPRQEYPAAGAEQNSSPTGWG